MDIIPAAISTIPVTPNSTYSVGKKLKNDTIPLTNGCVRLYANVPGDGLLIAEAVAVAKIDRMRPDSPIITPTISKAIAIVGMSNPLVPNVTLTNDPDIFAFLPPAPADGTTTETDILLHLKHLFEELINFSLRRFWSGCSEYGQFLPNQLDRNKRKTYNI